MDARMYPGAARFTTVTLAPAEVATIVAVEQDFTVPGVKANEMVIGFHYPATGGAVGVASARVKAANTIAVTFINPTAGALTPDAGSWTFATIPKPA